MAGILAAHGFFFGECRKADDKNPKGYFENLWAYSHKNNPQQFLSRLREEGLEPHQDWGLKCGSGFKPWLKAIDFDLIIQTKRDKKEHNASRKRSGFGGGWSPLKLGNVHTVDTTRLMMGDLTDIKEAFDKLERPFSEKLANDWIDPTIWNRGLRRHDENSNRPKDRR